MEMSVPIYVLRFNFSQTLCYDTILALTVLFLTGPWARDDTGSYYKAALLSGPPGVGKYQFGVIVCGT
jgi:hypothetical protein